MFSLNWLTSSSCISIVGYSYHKHFDEDGWLLLPHPDILEKFKPALKKIGHQYFGVRENFPEFDAVSRHLIMTQL